MKHIQAVVLTLIALLAVPSLASARAQPAPSETVRGYFAALGRQDFDGALALTAGEAQSRTARMVDTLQTQAARARAEVELKVQRVEVAEAQLQEEDGVVPVNVVFHIDVIGKKWMFKKVARRLTGTAQFRVDSERPRIVSIDGALE